MMPSKPDLIVLPFKATLMHPETPHTFEQMLSLLRGRQRCFVRIERSYPGAPHTIGWTIFHRTPHTYLYENEPLFRFERGARRHIRKAYAIHYLLVSDDGLTHTHLYL